MANALVAVDVFEFFAADLTEMYDDLEDMIRELRAFRRSRVRRNGTRRRRGSGVKARSMADAINDKIDEIEGFGINSLSVLDSEVSALDVSITTLSVAANDRGRRFSRIKRFTTKRGQRKDRVAFRRAIRSLDEVQDSLNSLLF